MRRLLRLPKKPWKTFLFGACVAGLTLLALDLAWVRYDRRIDVSPQTTAITQPLNANGTPDYVTALNQRFAQGVTPETNALPEILKLVGASRVTPDHLPSILSAAGIDESQARLAKVSDYYRWVHQLSPARQPPDKELEQTDSRISRHPWKRADEPLASEWIDLQIPQLPEVHKAALKPSFFVPWSPPQDQIHGLIGSVSDNKSPLQSVLPIASDMRMLADVLRADAMRCAGEGDWPAFRQDFLTISRLSRLVGQGPSLIEKLISIAMDAMASSVVWNALAASPLPEDLARQLLADLSSLPPSGDFADSFDTLERWYALDDAAYAAQIGIDHWYAQRLPTNLFGITTSEGPTLGWRLAALTIPVNFNRCMREINGIFDRLTVAARLPVYRDRYRAVADITQSTLLSDPKPSDLLSRPVKMLLHNDLSTVGGCFIMAQRAQAQHDLALIGLAIHLYHAAHSAYPASLLDLQTDKLLPALPQDGFTGSAYAYKVLTPGYALYTPGNEGKSLGDPSLESWGVLRVPPK